MPNKQFTKLKQVSNQLGKRRGLVLIGMILLLMFVLIAWQVQSREPVKQLPTTSSEIDAQIRDDMSTGDFEMSQAALQNAPETEEYEIVRITMYRSKGDNTSALTVYERLIKKLGISQGLANGAAQTAEAAGDYKKAIYYYQQARKLAEESKSPIKESELGIYDAKINSLEGR